jgi:hypothetical protein
MKKNILTAESAENAEIKWNKDPLRSPLSLYYLPADSLHFGKRIF